MTTVAIWVVGSLIALYFLFLVVSLMRDLWADLQVTKRCIKATEEFVEAPEPDPELTDEQKVRDWFSAGHTTCFDCGSPLLAGPRGGMMQNCICTECFAEFNVGALFSERLALPGEGRKHMIKGH